MCENWYEKEVGDAAWIFLPHRFLAFPILAKLHEKLHSTICWPVLSMMHQSPVAASISPEDDQDPTSTLMLGLWGVFASMCKSLQWQAEGTERLKHCNKYSFYRVCKETNTQNSVVVLVPLIKHRHLPTLTLKTIKNKLVSAYLAIIACVARFNKSMLFSAIATRGKNVLLSFCDHSLGFVFQRATTRGSCWVVVDDRRNCRSVWRGGFVAEHSLQLCSRSNRAALRTVLEEGMYSPNNTVQIEGFAKFVALS